MKIKNVSCTQFAGVRDRNVSFADGMNVIYGKNESGKSTLVSLISRALFQTAKLDRRSDREFFELYFPAPKKGSRVKGDYADGKVTVENESGSYTLSKEWGADARSSLSAPDGVIRDQARIDELLKELLVYGEGVYSDLLFSSQRNTDNALKTILDATKKTDAKQQLTEALSQAFAESDGVSVDAIEQAINDKIAEIAGSHWDFEREAPTRKAGRWSNGLGEILKAYYAMEDAKNVLAEISRMETEADRAANDYAAGNAAVAEAEERFGAFNRFASRLAVRNERSRRIIQINKELAKITEVLDNWPRLAESLDRAEALQDEKQKRELLDKYAQARAIKDEINALDGGVADIACPTNDEIALAKTAQRRISALENKLCGMNMTAAVNMLGGHDIKVASLLTGRELDLADGAVNIAEAVKITVPGVMELQLSPVNVDATAVETEIGEQRAALSDIFTRYAVDNADALEAFARAVAASKMMRENAESRLALVLGGVEFDAVEKKAHEIGEGVRAKEEIERDIYALCGGVNLSAFITKAETVMDGYTADYVNIAELKAKAFDLKTELEKARASVDDTEDIPLEFLGVSDPEKYRDDLQNELRRLRRLGEDALAAKTAAASRLETYRESCAVDPQEDAAQKERAFAETKSLLYHWLHIAEVFQSEKAKLHNNPMQDLADAFVHYLNIISGGKLTSELNEDDKLDMSIYSDDKLLDFAKLSEGTKETVSLAFRLAVLDHLFPDGGGVIVLDDPFTDMDAERAALACKLVRDCSERHQVIFLTCREEYVSVLGGNSIYF